MINLELLLQTLDFKKCDQLSYLVTEQNLEMLSYIGIIITLELRLLILKSVTYLPTNLPTDRTKSRDAIASIKNGFYPNLFRGHIQHILQVHSTVLYSL